MGRRWFPYSLRSLHEAGLSRSIFAIFYYDQRMGHEGFDIEQMMDAAGLNPIGSPPGDDAPAAQGSGAKQGAEEGLLAGKLPERHTSGAEAHLDFIAFPARLKSCPVTKPSRIPATASFSGAFLAIFLSVPQTCCAQGMAPPNSTAAQSSSQPRDASLVDYRAHLLSLNSLVRACAKARDIATCDPTQVGPDDRVPVSPATNAERRLVRYGWLRVLISKAQDKDAPAPKPTGVLGSQAWENVRPVPPTTTQLLLDAQTRLAHDLAQADAAAAPLPGHDQERAAMKKVLAGGEYSNLAEDAAKNSAYEKVGDWLNNLLASAVRASARAPWLGRALVWGFIGAVCVALVWGLLQLERRWRIRLVPEDRGPAPGAASAIPWQLWLEDARRAAAAGLWREAIHFLYWAAISRLESKRLWPADRARTPREYLALVASDDPRHPGLATLTGSFERVWYGGRPAGESDYRRAEQITSALISGASTESAGGAGQ